MHKVATLASSALILAACFGIQEDPVNKDVAAPSVDSASFSFTVTTTNAISFVWNPAVDDVSPREKLRYQVMMSTQNNIGTLEAALNNGQFAKVWTTNISALTVADLRSACTYYFTVLVKDEADNMAAYRMGSRRTASIPEIVPPGPGGSGALVFDQVATNSIRIVWTRGTDNATPQTNLMYMVVRSLSANIGTETEATNNGTVVMDWTRDAASAVAQGLAYDTLYHFNVLVRDEYGNITAYAMSSQTTADLPTVATPVIGPVAGTYTNAQSVTFTSATPGATYRYTVDGTTPSATNGAHYTGAFTISYTRNFKVVARKPGYHDSAVATATVAIHNSIIVVTGAGTAEANGTYYLASNQVNGKRYWQKNGGYYFVEYYPSGATFWVIANSIPPVPGGAIKYFQYYSGAYPSATTWFTENGSNPVPTFSIHD